MVLLPRSIRRRRSTIIYCIIAVLMITAAGYYLDLFPTSNLAVFSRRYIRYQAYKQSESHRVGPGEGGQAVHLQGDEKKKADSLIEAEAFNRIASDKISLERSLVDVRDERWVHCCFDVFTFHTFHLLLLFCLF